MICPIYEDYKKYLNSNDYLLYSVINIWSHVSQFSMEDGNFTLFSFTASLDVVSSSVLASVLIIAMILALVVNTTVLILTAVSKEGRASWKQPSAIFFNFLIISHYATNITYIPITVGGIAAREWIYGSTFKQKSFTCSFTGTTLLSTFFLMSFNLSLISFDRCLFITKPLIYKKYIIPKLAVSLCVGAWLIVALFSLIFTFGLSETIVYQSEYGYCSNTSVPRVIAQLVMTLCFFSVIFVTSIWTFWFTHKFIKYHTTTNINNNEESFISPKKRLFGIFGTMMMLYIICGLPVIVNVIITLAGVSIPELFFVALTTFQLFTILNPLVQLYFRPEFKVALKFLFKKSHNCCKANSTGDRVI